MDSRLEEGSIINDNSKKKGVKLQVCGVINHFIQKPVIFEETRTKTSFAFSPKIKKGGRHVCVLVAKYCFPALLCRELCRTQFTHNCIAPNSNTTQPLLCVFCSWHRKTYKIGVVFYLSWVRYSCGCVVGLCV